MFARLPALVERAGNGAHGRGSITAFYTVLTEGDDQQDPIADAARAILDGHIVLSRRIAEAGQYPAIDVEASVSRVMHEIIPPEHAELARRFRQTLSIYQQHRDLIAIGAYQKGSDPRIDAAIELWPAMQKFLMQPIEERVGQRDAVQALRAVVCAARRRREGGRMKRSERLDVVQQATARTEREHAERVARAERHVAEMEEKLAALEKYRKRIRGRLRRARRRRASDAAGVRDFQAFLARLGEALTQQRRARRAGARKRTRPRCASWREAAQRAHVVDTLAERWQAEESREESRRDQQESDELSQQRVGAAGANEVISSASDCQSDLPMAAATARLPGDTAPVTPASRSRTPLLALQSLRRSTRS